MSFIVGSILTGIGAVLLISSSLVGFSVVPNVINSQIVDQMVLINDTIQMERFEVVPFELVFRINVFNIENPNQVLAGAKPILTERGPYIYKLIQRREVLDTTPDTISYYRWEHFEFDPVASFPLTDEDVVTIPNIAFNAVLQLSESLAGTLMPLINRVRSEVFGDNDSPIIRLRVKDLTFEGVTFCSNITSAIGRSVCGAITQISQTSKNIEVLEDGSLRITALGYRQGIPSLEFVAIRGIEHPVDLGQILTYGHETKLNYWKEEPVDPALGHSICNQVKGTDAGIYGPFVDRNEIILVLNTDICRSLELFYSLDETLGGIPTAKFTSDDRLFANDEHCFCLNVTRGVNEANGCLLRGAMEMSTCVGAPLVVTQPHFLNADPVYQNGVSGLSPDPDIHEIFVNLEPRSGTVVRGAKRAQINIFLRPIRSIALTDDITPTLTPIFWIDEFADLPEEFVEELTTRLLQPINLVSVLIPVVIAVSSLVLLVGVGLLIRTKIQIRKQAV